jgi:hypothetical protein
MISRMIEANFALRGIVGAESLGEIGKVEAAVVSG